jgi:uncharacterized membrane protein YciS (DUF1049 family)
MRDLRMRANQLTCSSLGVRLKPSQEAEVEEQNFKNHTKVVPGFVYFVLPVLLLNLVSSLLRLKQSEFSFNGLVGALTAVALIAGFSYARTFALRVQDRVIRLEEQLRYARILPADLQARMSEFTLAQMIALRFASDAELPALARKTLDDNLSDGKAIKGMVTNWRADHLRA